MTAKETYELFAKVEDKEQELRGVVDNVKCIWEAWESSDNICTSLNSFETISETITKSIGEISEQAEQQRTEVNGSVDICDKLNGKILSSETCLHKTVDNINHLKEKMMREW